MKATSSFGAAQINILFSVDIKIQETDDVNCYMFTYSYRRNTLYLTRVDIIVGKLCENTVSTMILENRCCCKIWCVDQSRTQWKYVVETAAAAAMPCPCFCS